MVQSSLSFSPEEEGCLLKVGVKVRRMHVREHKTDLDSGWNPRHGFWISCHWNLDHGFQLLAGFWIPWAEVRIPKPWIPDYTNKNFPNSGIGITLQGAVIFFILGTLLWAFKLTACFAFAKVFIWLHIPCDSDRDGRFCRRCCRKQCSSWPID